ncbi:hypothetical protein QE369_003465 [Agrobacterium larrymoorei]|uniref:Uncharacterized protein n=1 Tax=Agrobacterium larrymoorei TaxID=160699 RepID=A0AAJ2EU65_9HYPH|nr:hypothetical protein [Agrobacterium larrymoorei]MDR6103268.1 hypothetical protein [Agrobacterium larrymoorei]
MSYNVLSQAAEVYNRADAKVFGDLTVAEFDAVHDAIDNITEVGRSARRIQIDGEWQDLDAVLGLVLAAVEQRSVSQNADLRRRLKALGAGAVMPLSLEAAQRPVELWAQDMDGGEAGICSRLTVAPVRQAFERYVEEKAAYLRSLHAIIEPRTAELLGPAIGAPELGFTFENKGQLFHALLHTGNDSNKRKLMAGRGWQAGWERFLARMWREGTLTKADYDAAQAIWGLMERLKQKGQEAHREICGFSFREVKPAALKTPFGTYAGGFVPAVFERGFGVANQEGRNPAEMFPTVPPAFTAQGTENDARPLVLECSMLAAHMDQLLRFIHIEPVMQQIGRIVNRPEFSVALDDVSPDMMDTVIVPWLRMVRQPVAEVQPTTAEGRALSYVTRAIRGRAGARNMMLDIVSATASTWETSSVSAQISTGRLEAALVRFAKQGEGAAMRGEVARLSSVMNSRMRRSSRDMEACLRRAIAKPGDLGLIAEKSALYGEILLKGTGDVLDLVLWHAAHDQVIAEGTTQAEAVAKADALVIGSDVVEGGLATESGLRFARLFTLLHSYFNSQTRLSGGNLHPIMQSYGYEGAPRLFAVYLAGVAIPAVVAKVITAAPDQFSDGSSIGELAGLFFGAQSERGAGLEPIAEQNFNAFTATWNETSAARSRLSRADAVAGDGLAALAMVLGISLEGLVQAAGLGDVDVEADPNSAFDTVPTVSSAAAFGGAAQSQPDRPEVPLRD